jgi:hypothetical protein
MASPVPSLLHALGLHSYESGFKPVRVANQQKFTFPTIMIIEVCSVMISVVKSLMQTNRIWTMPAAGGGSPANTETVPPSNGSKLVHLGLGLGHFFESAARSRAPRCINIISLIV